MSKQYVYLYAVFSDKTGKIYRTETDDESEALEKVEQLEGVEEAVVVE
ncbi:hypothetical protein [Haladaptatus cibarius]|nr:hypothetical protein [Haladaptatus cibarius]